MKRIAVLTRDCAGINAAIRAVVRTATSEGLEVMGILRGYEGLIEGDFIPLDRKSVSNIIGQGGTILKTSRSERFFEAKFQQEALKNLKANKIDGLIVLGGNGSLRGAHILAKNYGFRTVGIPATIDNDINGVEMSIGADTAVNVALDALDKIRDTSTSLERIFVVEVMGRFCGFIAMKVALAGGCEEVLIPERSFDLGLMCQEIEAGHKKGKKSWIIIVTEGVARAVDIAREISNRTGLETRIVVLGHVQRGGRPTAFDRIMAACLGSAAVKALIEEMIDICVYMKNDQTAILPLEIAIQPKTTDFSYAYHLLKILS